ncbi:hypothetical protein B0H21DRAFT_764245, partial [Amylocystis lapponica]
MPSTSTSTAATPGLSNLTVPQLKAICKERKITGYSKLGKAALLQILAETQDRTAHTASISATTNGETASVAVRKRKAVENWTASSQAAESTSTGGLQQPAKKSKPRIQKSKPPASVPTIVLTPTVQTVLPSPPLRSPSAAPSVRASAHVLLPEDGLPHSSNNKTPNATPGLCALSTEGSESSVPPATRGVAEIPLRTNVVGTKRPSNAPERPVEKKQKTSQKKHPENAPAIRSFSAFKTPALPLKILSPALDYSDSTALPASMPLAPTSIPVAVSAVHSAAQILKPRSNISATAVPTGKRFKPLVIAKPSVKGPASEHTPSDSLSKPRSETLGVPNILVQSQTHHAAPALYYLDLPPPPSVQNMVTITLPPSLSQRKRVQCWAVILSGLTDEGRRQCVLVSRTFRYAVYLSAAHILRQRFRGARLTQEALQRYSLAMTNMWPYLRMRELEVSQRRQAYECSFIAHFFTARDLPSPIADHLWASPDCERQAVIGLRFIMTRLWFALSVGGPDDSTGSESWLCGTVTDVQEVIKGEIWSITVSAPLSQVSSSGRKEILYVLEATCEVVGHPMPKLDALRQDTGVVPKAAPTSIPLRDDWSVYIQQRLTISPEGTVSCPLLSHLKWANCEEYDRGISRLWLKRVSAEGALGAAKRVVAERYVLACVSQRAWMTATEMAQDFAGLPTRMNGGVKGKTPTVHLYLPEHHHVESVHFCASDGRPMHSALAVVQTPHREYYILRDNGMQVGCEEDGVAPLWQEALRCDRLGF